MMIIKNGEQRLNTTTPGGFLIIAIRDGGDCRIGRIIDGVYSVDHDRAVVDVIAAKWAQRPECKGYSIFVAELSRVTDELIHAVATDADLQWRQR
jgi:hypothetical protein